MKQELFDKFIESIRQAGKIIRKEEKPSRVFKIKKVNVKSVRTKVGLSQTEFAMVLGIPLKTLQNWEQEIRKPTGSALSLLTIFNNDPQHALKALHAKNSFNN